MLDFTEATPPSAPADGGQGRARQRRPGEPHPLNGDDRKIRHLAELDLLTRVVVARRANDGEQDVRLVIELDLWAQMKGLRVLHSEFVEAKPLLQLDQLLAWS